MEERQPRCRAGALSVARHSPLRATCVCQNASGRHPPADLWHRILIRDPRRVVARAFDDSTGAVTPAGDADVVVAAVVHNDDQQLLADERARRGASSHCEGRARPAVGRSLPNTPGAQGIKPLYPRRSKGSRLSTASKLPRPLARSSVSHGIGGPRRMPRVRGTRKLTSPTSPLVASRASCRPWDVRSRLGSRC